MKVRRMEIPEIFRRIWLFSGNKIKFFESVSKQPTQLTVEDFFGNSGIEKSCVGIRIRIGN